MTVSAGISGGSVLGVVFGSAAAGLPPVFHSPVVTTPATWTGFTGGGAVFGPLAAGPVAPAAAPPAQTAGQGALHTLSQLPFTGASHLMLLVALGLIAIVAGGLMLGLVRQSDARSAGTQPA